VSDSDLGRLATRPTLLLQAAINGSRAPADHPAVPVHPAELAAAAQAVVDAGAGAIHAHARAADGGESLAAADVGLAVTAVRAACGGRPVGVSTGAWIEPDPDRRLGLIRRWQVLPDFASVNFHEIGAVEIAKELLEAGVAVEAGLVDPAAAEVLLRAGLEHRCLRLLLEPQEQELRAAIETVDAVIRVLERSGGETSRLLHGTESTTWPLLAEAVRRGYDIRIGLEDTLRRPDGTLAEDNADLIGVARALHRLA
jgi:uncharacterized protein (DUF849 family)